jgi:hypothetical protein
MSQFQRGPNIQTGTSSSVPPVHSVSHFRQSPISDSNEPTLEDQDFLHREGKFHFPKSDCPGFNGTNPIEWLQKCTSFFELHQVPAIYRTHLAILQFHDKANEWYDSYLLDHVPPDWNELVQLVNGRFNVPITRTLWKILRL